MFNKKVLVKSITNLSEARYCAGMFVDYISFDLNESSEYFIPKKQFEEIRGWLSGIQILGSLATNDTAQINQAIVDYQLDGFILSQEQFSLSSFIETETLFLEWNAEDLSFLPQDLDPQIILIIKASSSQEIQVPEVDNICLLGYDFELVKNHDEAIEGFAFMGSFETQVGITSSTELMEAFEYIEENF